MVYNIVDERVHCAPECCPIYFLVILYKCVNHSDVNWWGFLGVYWTHSGLNILTLHCADAVFHVLHSSCCRASRQSSDDHTDPCSFVITTMSSFYYLLKMLCISIMTSNCVCLAESMAVNQNGINLIF